MTRCENKTHKKIKFSKEDLLIGIIYVFLSRVLNFAFFASGQVLNVFYTTLSKVVAFLIIILFLLSCAKQIKLLSRYKYVIVFVMLMGISTLIGKGDFRRYFSLIYTILAMAAFVELGCQSWLKTRKFIHAIAWLYFLAVGINLIFLVIAPDLFGDVYLINMENQMAYPVLIGFIFCYLNYLYNEQKWMFIIYGLVAASTLLIIFSANNLIGMMPIVLYIFIIPVRKYLQKNNLTILSIVYAILFISIVVLGGTNFFDIPIVKYVIEEVLGKSATLTGRTGIWNVAIEYISKSPILGYGIRDSINVFAYNNLKYSAHNQWVQGLYEIGVLGILPIVALYYGADKALMKTKDRRLTGMYHAEMISLIVLMLAEVPGWNPVIFVFYFGLRLAEQVKNQPDSGLVIPDLDLY